MANENKIKSYKDIVDRDTIFGRIKGTPIKPVKKENNILKTIIDFGKEAIKPELVSQEFEKQALPQYSQSKNPIVRAITTPGTAIARGSIKTASRLFPGVLELGKNFAEPIEISRKGGIAEKIEKGDISPDVLKDFKTLEKSNVQIVGDVGKAFLELYAPKAVTKAVGFGMKRPIREAFKTGFVQNAPLGTAYELFNIASEKDKITLKEYATRLGVSTLTVGLLGGIVSGAVPVSNAVKNKVQQFFAIKKLDPDVFTRIVSSRKVPTTSLSGETNIPISTPSKRYAEYRQKMGYEPYVPQEQLPTIEMGRKPQTTTGLPIIQTEPRVSQNRGDSILEPIKQTTNEIINNGRQAPSLLTPTPDTIKPEIDLSVPSKEAAETIQPVISQDIEAQAISQKIADKFEDIPNVPKMNMKESIDNAVNLSDLDFEKAKRVALGDEKPPTNTEIGFVYEAVKEKAIKNNDWQLLRELATNPNAAPTQATRAGQIVKSFDTLNDSIDPVELMQKVVDSRKKGVSLVKKNEVAKSTRLIKDSLEKAKPKKNDWVEFINSIEC